MRRFHSFMNVSKFSAWNEYKCNVGEMRNEINVIDASKRMERGKRNSFHEPLSHITWVQPCLQCLRKFRNCSSYAFGIYLSDAIWQCEWEIHPTHLTVHSLSLYTHSSRYNFATETKNPTNFRHIKKTVTACRSEWGRFVFTSPSYQWYNYNWKSIDPKKKKKNVRLLTNFFNFSRIYFLFEWNCV